MDGESDHRSLSFLYLKSAFLAMEPTDCLITLARQSGGGSITTEVQNFILNNCIDNAMGKETARKKIYIRNVLKKIITAAQPTCDIVDSLYEEFANYLNHVTEDDLPKDTARICKQVSFLFSGGDDIICSGSNNLVVPLQCSLNLLEGDTGCALWPSSLFLSEFILSYPKMFANKFCFEVGSGVGLVGISLTHVGASKVVLTDGDISSLANMKVNLELNHLTAETTGLQSSCQQSTTVECKYLPWESASESELQGYQPDIVLGADVVYDPSCIPYLVRVLSILLNPKRRGSSEPEARYLGGYEYTSGVQDTNTVILPKKAKEEPIAYLATVIRNRETFNSFLRLASGACLSILDITPTLKPTHLLPYMCSYDRSSVCLYRISYSYN